MSQTSYDFLPVTQSIGTFYLCVIKAIDLLESIDILRRGMTADERANVQRHLSPKRQSEIATYFDDPDATFPTSIIISAYPDGIEFDEKQKKLRFTIGDKIGEVIDGQHRLEGIRLAIEREGKERAATFDLPVVIMTGLSQDSKAYVFSIINSKQTPVSSSLIFDLFGLRDLRSPMKVCHDIAEIFNARKDGPFFRGIKMLGRKYFDTELLTQGAFVKYLMEELISRRPDEDMRLQRLGKPLVPDETLPLRAYYIKKQDDLIAKILHNFFSAVRNNFPNEWSQDPKKYILRKTAGYLALLLVFKWDWQNRVNKSKDASFEAYQEVAASLRKNSRAKELSSTNFASNEQGAKKLAEFLYHPAH